MSDQGVLFAVVSLQTQMSNLLTAQQTTNELLAKILAFLQQPSGSDIRDLIVQILTRLDAIDQGIVSQNELSNEILNSIRHTFN